MTVVNPENFLQIVPYVKGNDQGYIFFTIAWKMDLYSLHNKKQIYIRHAICHVSSVYICY